MDRFFGLKFTTWAAVAGVMVILAGCAHPQLVDMGTEQRALVDYLGEPAAKTPMPDGSLRYTYSGQPFGQDVWWIFVDKSGKVVSREQGLQEKYFHLLTPGKSTEADVWALWGRCAEKYEFPLVGQHAWMYRYKAPGGLDMAVWPQFDVNGVLRSMDVTEDPWRLYDSGDFE